MDSKGKKPWFRSLWHPRQIQETTLDSRSQARHPMITLIDCSNVSSTILRKFADPTFNYRLAGFVSARRSPRSYSISAAFPVTAHAR